MRTDQLRPMHRATQGTHAVQTPAQSSSCPAEQTDELTNLVVMGASVGGTNSQASTEYMSRILYLVRHH